VAPALPNGSAAETVLSIGQAATPLLSATGIQAVAFATGSPLASDVNTALSGMTTVTAAGINSTDAIALMVLGGAYSTSGTGSAATFTSTISFTLGSFSAGTLKIGFLSTAAAPFHSTDSLTFTLLGASTPINQTFITLSSAQTYFKDNAVSLGAFNGNTTITIQLTFTGDLAGDMYDTQFILADVVPEPSPAWLLLFGCVPLFIVRRRSARGSR
jgi:hypothetical protein